MTKIKSIEELQNERMRIRQHQIELEARMQDDWSDLKEYLRPGSITENKVRILTNKTRQNLKSTSVVKSVFLFIVTLMARKFADNAEEKLTQYFKGNLSCLRPEMQKQIEI
jgi:hypothetical protein